MSLNLVSGMLPLRMGSLRQSAVGRTTVVVWWVESCCLRVFQLLGSPACDRVWSMVAWTWQARRESNDVALEAIFLSLEQEPYIECALEVAKGCFDAQPATAS